RDPARRPHNDSGDDAVPRAGGRGLQPDRRHPLRVPRPAGEIHVSPLLQVEDLRVHFETEDGIVQAVDGISYEVDSGRALGIVGESGSGKSVSSLTVMGLTRSRSARISGRIV